MNEQIKKDLGKVKRFLDNRKIEFKVVGSIALEVCGLPIGRQVDDIDLEVVCSNRQEEIFKALAEAQGNNFFEQSDYSIKGCSHKPYIFQFGKTKVNVWCFKEFSSPAYVEKDDMRYATIMDVLTKKLAYKRAKDFTDLLTIVSNLSTLGGIVGGNPGTPQG